MWREAEDQEIRVQDSRTAPPGYVFRCRDVGAECHEELNSVLAFVKRPKPRTPSSDPHTNTPLDASMMSNASPSVYEPEGATVSQVEKTPKELVKHPQVCRDEVPGRLARMGGSVDRKPSWP